MDVPSKVVLPSPELKTYLPNLSTCFNFEMKLYEKSTEQTR